MGDSVSVLNYVPCQRLEHIVLAIEFDFGRNSIGFAARSGNGGGG